MNVNKVVYNNRALIDLTSDSVTISALKKGTTAHDNKGNAITGTALIAEGIKMIFYNITIPTSAWVASNTFAWLSYQATVTCNGVTENDYPNVIFAKASCEYLDGAGINLERSSTGENIVTVFASDKPGSNIVIDRIELT